METLANVFQQLLSMAATALPVMAVVLLARVLLKKAPKKYVYLLWLVVAFRLVCPVALESPVGIIQTETVDRQLSEMTDIYVGSRRTILNTPNNQEEFGRAVENGREPFYAGMPGSYYVETAMDGMSEPATVGNVVLPVASVVWLLGMAVVAAYLIFSTLRLRRQVTTAVRREDNIWECDSIPTPFVLGLFRPRIYIPFRMTEPEREYILTHERYHIRWGDHWVKLLGFGILAVYWWNPSVWLCWMLQNRDMEMRCDEEVLAKLGDGVKREYSLSLLSFALDRRASMALAFGERDAARRVKNVLKWKKAKPAAGLLAVVAVIVVAAVCGTNARQGQSIVTLEFGESDGVEFEVCATEDIHCWALYADIYENGMLVSSDYRVMDGFAEENTGVTPREFAGRLWAELPNHLEGGFTGEMTWNFTVAGIATFYETLPKDYYTGMAVVIGEGEEKTYRVETDGEVLLCSVLLSTKADGAVTFSSAEKPLTQLNDTVVQYRLVLSGGTMEELEIPPLDLAQTLYDLRVTTLREASDAEPLLETLGVGQFGDYEVSTSDSANGKVLHISFQNTLNEQQELQMSENTYLLLALLRDVDRVDYAFPTEDGSSTMTFYSGGDPLDNWARALGYEDIKDLGQSAKGIRALMDYLSWKDAEKTLKEAGMDSEGAGERALTVTAADGGRIDAFWYADGTVEPNEDDLPSLTLGEDTHLTLAASGEPETLAVEEEYYHFTDTGTSLLRETYTLPRSADGTYDLMILQRDDSRAEKAVYRVPYENGTFAFRVTLPGKGDGIDGQKFSNILGYDGIIKTEGAADIWQMRTYYAVENGEKFPIAESFGFGAPQDYSVDVDGDGVEEFVTNVQFGGDGHQDVYVYRRVGDGPDGIQRGTLDLSELPNHDNWGVNSTAAEYAPAEGVFRVRYAQKNTEEIGILETRGLERFGFTKYGNG